MTGKMQYLVSLSDETIEKVIEIEKWWKIGRDEIIEHAINSLYQREVDHRNYYDATHARKETE